MEFLLNHAYSYIFGLAAFLIFFVLIAKFGVKPIVAAIDAREERIAKQLKEAEETAARAKQLKDQLDAQLRGAETKIGEMMAEARRDAETHKQAMVEQGRQEMDALKVRASRDIEAARHAAVVSLKREVAEIATQVAEKVLRQQLDAANQERLVTAAIEAYESRGAKA